MRKCLKLGFLLTTALKEQLETRAERRSARRGSVGSCARLGGGWHPGPLAGLRISQRLFKKCELLPNKCFKVYILKV